MPNNIKSSLKKHSKLTKCYYKNDQKKSCHEKLLEKPFGCSKKTSEAKNHYVLKMTTKLRDPKAAAKTYYFTRKKLQQYHLYLLMVNLSLIFVKKQIFLRAFLRQYVHQ